MSGIPRFFLLNDTPVKVVMHPKGGYDVMALDMATGDWVPTPAFLDRFLRRDGEIELLSEEEFKDRVSEIRKELGVQEFE